MVGTHRPIDSRLIVVGAGVLYSDLDTGRDVRNVVVVPAIQVLNLSVESLQTALGVPDVVALLATAIVHADAAALLNIIRPPC